MKKIIPIIVILMSCTAAVSAQDYRFDAGLAGGISCYMGDANQVSPWHRPGAAISGVFRFLLNYRWAVKTDISAMQFSGDTRDFDNQFPNGGAYSFESWQYRLGGQIEFNFFNYGMGYSYLNTKRISPYLLAGAGVGYSTVDGGYVSVDGSLGLGVKYKIAPRWNISLEFAMHKTLGDSFDGKSLSDPYHIKSSVLKNTDWFSTTLFSITYEFGRKKEICNNNDNR